MVYCTLCSLLFCVFHHTTLTAIYQSWRKTAQNQQTSATTAATQSATLAVILNDMQECLCSELFCFQISAKNHAVEMGNRQRKKKGIVTQI